MEVGNSYAQKFVEHTILASMYVGYYSSIFLIKMKMLAVAIAIGIAVTCTTFLHAIITNRQQSNVNLPQQACIFLCAIETNEAFVSIS